MKKLKDGVDSEITGMCFLIYGAFGVGKTDSLGTLPDPIFYIGTEPRDPRIVLKRHKEKEFSWRFPESFDETIELLSLIETSTKAGKFKFRSVAFDSLSFTQGSYKLDLEDDRYTERVRTEKAREGLIDRFRIDEADWGAVGSIMKRITSSLNRLSQYGIIVVATATEMQSPRWNRELVAAPAFQGREYPMLVNGYFDFIGYVERSWWIEEKEDTKIIHPATVSFVSPPDEPYVAKSCSIKLSLHGKGPLDFQKILSAIREE